MDDFEKALPAEIVDSAMRSGSELIIPLDGAIRAVQIAKQNLIAVLGVEVFRLLGVGLGIETYSGYEFSLARNWETFVLLNNEAALQFIEGNRFGQGYGHILTTTSEDEFRQLPRTTGSLTT